MTFHQVKKRIKTYTTYSFYFIYLFFFIKFLRRHKNTISLLCAVQSSLPCTLPLHSILTVRTTPDIHISQPRNTLAVPYCNNNTVSPHGGSVSPSPNKPAIYSWRFLVFPVPFFSFFFSFSSLLSFLPFLPSSQGLVATLPRYRSPFSFLFGRHSRFLVSCLTAGAKRCVGFGPPSPRPSCLYLLYSLPFV
ncbi:uncharacterized protein EURHEDRAFT_67053 [Aspergillus ruber CBS 135680]|uniref:Uncharacterized protein n=1 Tax=Aspergillus ruber (strain CBS 135680) TaxID=1388766 RepID=A0A017SEE9_ASPRC|nr:uncharacterized protein EURHEDRAFT_67053 [Aspergillus ruber CBS 135680]EYE95141.1 hypothetical protein EURHEDRAFT_67053 [Aspergillus ruber CBS 135680]